MESLDKVVDTIREMVKHDGYDVRLDGYGDGELRLTILAGPDACEECLVPKDILARIIATTLPSELAAAKVVLTYPAEAH